ncbi:unnamed protein product [Tetraodon nigroviridis]|uniref:(spotted green pufferfish) hypothetical protein n=1 Tax=Tetraodon nigroviridis TaxID=99883 RepID=Q4RM56_TETNG|nr:unnamed protein product [Tetraodon nigroviridis]
MVSEVNKTDTCDVSVGDIPAVSLCPPDSDGAADLQLTVLDCEAELGDSCSSPCRPSSSCQPYQQAHQCHGCHQHGPAPPKTCHAAGPCDEGQTVDSYGSAHQLPRHQTEQCHWLQGSKDSRTERVPRRPGATGRSVPTQKRATFSLRVGFNHHLNLLPGVEASPVY